MLLKIMAKTIFKNQHIKFGYKSQKHKDGSPGTKKVHGFLKILGYKFYCNEIKKSTPKPADSVFCFAIFALKMAHFHFTARKALLLRQHRNIAVHFTINSDIFYNSRFID